MTSLRRTCSAVLVFLGGLLLLSLYLPADHQMPLSSPAIHILPPPAPVKIFIYDNDEIRKVTEAVKSVTRQDCQLGPGFDMFNMEVHLHQALLSLAQRPPIGTDPLTVNLTGVNNKGDAARTREYLEIVSEGSEADFFFVPCYPNLFMCAAAHQANRTFLQLDYIHALQIAFESIRRSPFWQRKNGTDHIFTVTHGWGPTVLPEEVNRHSIRLLSNGDLTSGFDPLRDIVIPPSIGEYSQECGETGYSSSHSRHILASFKGLIRNHWWHSKGIRQLWRELYKESSEVLIDGERDGPYTQATSSVFCLCPPGLSLWTPRPVESLFFGCIPVVLGDDLVLPFEDLLDWSQFSIKIRENEAPWVRELLLSVPESAITQKRGVMSQVYRWFWFGDDQQNVLQLLGLSLALRLNPEIQRNNYLQQARFWM